MAQATVSVVIPVYNEGPRLQLTLEALRASTALLYEVVVVNDGSTDGAVDHLHRNPEPFEEVRIVEQARGGPAAARNRGAAEANGEILVFLDAHTFPRRGWLERLLAVLDEHPQALLTPTISVAGNSGHRAYGLRFRNDLSLVALTDPPTGLSEVPLAPGCCLALSRAGFQRLGGFDQMYGLEDVELSLRWWLCGYEVLIEPSVEVAHTIKRHRLDDSALEAQLYSLMRMSLVHMDAATNERMLAGVRHLPAYRRALTRLATDDFWQWFDFINGLKCRDFGWFLDRFVSSS